MPSWMIKRFNSISLRLRLTLLMAIILTISCLMLMTVSIFTAQRVYKIPEIPYEGIQTDKMPPIPEPPQLPPMPKMPPISNLPEADELVRIKQNNDFAYSSLLFSISVIVFGTGLTYIISGRALKPVTELSKEIEEIDENNLFVRVEVPESNDEVTRLSVSFNSMIGKLEKAFTSQKNFSANVAHELKTPLAAMIAGIEVLQLDDNPDLDQYKETMNDTLKNAQRLNSLVNDLLKLNSAKGISKSERFEAGKMFENILQELAQNIRGKEIQIENNVHGILLKGEKDLLYRAFFNLIHNAIKYNKRSGVIKISTLRDAYNTIISICDTGIGISEEQKEKIFEPFYCVDKSRSRELGGSGLGLSIVKSVIEKHGGEIKVQSEIGLSTTMIILLPNN